MATIGALNIKLGLSAAAFTSGLQSATGQVSGFASKITGAFAALAAGPAGIGAMLGGLGAGGFGSFITEAFKSADAAGDMADRLGLSVTALTELQHAAKMTDVDQEALNTGLAKFSRTIGEAETGSKEATATLGALGLSASQLAGMDLTAAMGQAADVIKDLATDTQQGAAACALFGKQGQALLPLLRQGKDGIAGFAEEARRLGISLSAVDSKKIQDADSAMKRASQAFAGIGRKLAVAFAPLIEKVAVVASQIMAALQPAIAWLTDAFGAVVDVAFELWDTIGAGIQELLPCFQPLLDWIGEMGISFDSGRDTAMGALQWIMRGLSYVTDALKIAGGFVFKYFTAPFLEAISKVAAAIAKLFDLAGRLPDQFGGAMFRGLAQAARGYSKFEHALSLSVGNVADKLLETKLGDGAEAVDAMFERIKAKHEAAANRALPPKVPNVIVPPAIEVAALKLPEAIVRGSKEDISIRNRAGGGNPIDKLRELQAQHVGVARQQLEVAKGIERNTRTAALPPVQI